MHRTTFAALLGIALLIGEVSAATMPTLTIVNQAPDGATVKVVGPTSGVVEIGAGGQRTVELSGGVYELRIRYCNAAGCRYTRTNSFAITQTPRSVSRATITLRSSSGNLGEKPISPSEF